MRETVRIKFDFEAREKQASDPEGPNHLGECYGTSKKRPTVNPLLSPPLSNKPPPSNKPSLFRGRKLIPPPPPFPYLFFTNK